MSSPVAWRVRILALLCVLAVLAVFPTAPSDDDVQADMPLIVVHARGTYPFPPLTNAEIDARLRRHRRVLWLYPDDESAPVIDRDVFVTTASPDSQQVGVTGDNAHVVVVGGYWRACVMSVIAGIWRANPGATVIVPMPAVAYGERTTLIDEWLDDEAAIRRHVLAAVPDNYRLRIVVAQGDELRLQITMSTATGMTSAKGMNSAK